MREKLVCGCAVWLSGLLHSVDRSNQLFCRVRGRNIVVLALSLLFGEISGEGRIPKGRRILRRCRMRSAEALAFHDEERTQHDFPRETALARGGVRSRQMKSMS